MAKSENGMKINTNALTNQMFPVRKASGEYTPILFENILILAIPISPKLIHKVWPKSPNYFIPGRRWASRPPSTRWGAFFAPLTFSQISSECLGVSEQNLAHKMNTKGNMCTKFCSVSDVRSGHGEVRSPIIGSGFAIWYKNGDYLY